MAKDTKLEDIVSLAKRRGFIYQGSEVYGGLSGTWDYGPLGVTLKRNIMNLWWKMFVDERDDVYGVDAAILMNQKVWQASGHVDTFTDPLTICSNCNSRLRADKLINDVEYREYVQDVFVKFLDEQQNLYVTWKSLLEELDNQSDQIHESVQQDKTELEKLKKADVKVDVYKSWFDQYIDKLQLSGERYRESAQMNARLTAHLDVLSYIRMKLNDALSYIGDYTKHYLDVRVTCPVCGFNSKGLGNWSSPQRFNMMFKTNVGPVADDSSTSYLRPETAQGIFTNYKNVVDSFYPDLPFGIAQQGKAFRNEISPRDFIFRSREFEQMEIEYFVNPAEWEAEFEKWVRLVHDWCDALGLPKESVHELEVPENDRAHYSKRTIDFEFDFPIGREELLGLAYRTDFDLKNIHDNSGKSMEYTIKGTQDKFIPHVIEPSFGLERALMAVLCAAYTEDEVNGEKRTYLKFPEHLAPVKYAVSPLLKNKPELVEKAREVYRALQVKYPGRVMWDDNGNIGKRYRRQDEIGTPYCVVIDFDTLEDGTVTIRDRDTTDQKRVSVDELN